MIVPVVRELFGAAAVRTAERKATGRVPEALRAQRRRRAEERLLDALSLRLSSDLPADLRREVEDLLAAWAALGFDDGFDDVGKFELRCAEEPERRASASSQGVRARLQREEREYRRAVADRFGRVELKGLQLSHRVFAELEDLYVPLPLQMRRSRTVASVGLRVIDVSPETGAAKEPSWASLPHEVIHLAVNAPPIPVEFPVKAHRLLRITGGPGAGKSTLVAWLASRVGAGRILAVRRRAALPFVVVVRSLASPQLDVAAVAAASGCSTEFAARAFADCAPVLFVDGADEAAPEFRAALAAALRTLATEFPKLRIVVTSRPVSVAEEASWADYAQAQVAPLERETRAEFVRKWCLAAERSVKGPTAEAKRVAKEHADDLLDRIERSPAIERMASAPLVAAVLCTVHRFLGKRIPEQRGQLYEKCADVLLYEWDASKGAVRLSALSAEERKILLQRLAVRMHETRKAEAPEEDVVAAFEDALPDVGRPKSEARAMVAEIRDRSGLLVESKPGVFGFSHLAFQEFFAAREFVKIGRALDLIDRCGDRWWFEVVVLACARAELVESAVAHLVAANSDEALVCAFHCGAAAPSVSAHSRALLRETLAVRFDASSKLFNLAHRIGAAGSFAGEAVIPLQYSGNRPTWIWFQLEILRSACFVPAAGELLAKASRPNPDLISVAYVTSATGTQYQMPLTDALLATGVLLEWHLRGLLPSASALAALRARSGSELRYLFERHPESPELSAIRNEALARQS